jgi:hypothetical protein
LDDILYHKLDDIQYHKLDDIQYHKLDVPIKLNIQEIIENIISYIKLYPFRFALMCEQSTSDTYRVYFNAYKNVIQMMKDRGYDVGIYNKEITDMEFKIYYDQFSTPDHPTGHLFLSGIKKEQYHWSNDQLIPVYVIFLSNYAHMSKNEDKQKVIQPILDKIGLDSKGVNGDLLENFLAPHYRKLEVERKKYMEQVVTNSVSLENDSHLILVANLETLENKWLRELRGGMSNFEVFDINVICVNPTYHKYQPKWHLIHKYIGPKTTNPQYLAVMELFDASPTLLGSVTIDDPINRYYNGQIEDLYKIDRGHGMFFRKVSGKYMNISSQKNKFD